MKYTIKSLGDQNTYLNGFTDEEEFTGEEEHKYISFKELFVNADSLAIFDSETTIEFDDNHPQLITFIHTDANGDKYRKDYSLPKGRTYQVVLDKIKPLFDGEKLNIYPYIIPLKHDND